MRPRRVLCLWLPRLSAERALRAPDLDSVRMAQAADPAAAPGFAVTAEDRGALRVDSACATAAARGVRAGMGLADARAVHPALVTRMRDAAAEARFRAALLRWSRRWSPWTAEDGPAGPGEAGLAVDLTGTAHLFGGEAETAARMVADLAALGLSARAGVADTRGAAWALARFAAVGRSGDPGAVTVAAPGALHGPLADLPAAALRIPPDTAAALARLGLRRIGDLAGMPRGALARRFGADLLRRLDQALGMAAEPISPVAPEAVFAVRLTLPEPIGLRADLDAALARLLERLCLRLEQAGRGARRLRLSVRRADGGEQAAEVGLARAGRDPQVLAGLFDRALEGIDAGFGIDAVRLEAVATEAMVPRPHRGPFEAAPGPAAGSDDAALADLVGRLGARIGLERVMRWQPTDSHIPGKTAHLAAAAFSEPPPRWPAPPAPRPLELFGPDPCTPQAPGRPPAVLRWRRGLHRLVRAEGPERIAPEWWLDDPAWRTGVRDYWRVETETGQRLWLFEARPRPGASAGWFVHGRFA